MTSLINPDQAMTNAAHDEEMLCDLADIFRSTSPTLLNDLTTAINSRDAEAAARAAHTLKSPLGFFGAEQATRMAETVEQTADSGSIDELQPLLETLRTQIDQIHMELSEFLRPDAV